MASLCPSLLCCRGPCSEVRLTPVSFANLRGIGAHRSNFRYFRSQAGSRNLRLRSPRRVTPIRDPLIRSAVARRTRVGAAPLRERCYGERLRDLALLLRR